MSFWVKGEWWNDACSWIAMTEITEKKVWKKFLFHVLSAGLNMFVWGHCWPHGLICSLLIKWILLKRRHSLTFGLVLQIFFSVLEVIKRRFNKFNFHYVLRFMQDVLSLLVCSNDKTGLQVGMKLEIIVWIGYH